MTARARPRSATMRETSPAGLGRHRRGKCRLILEGFVPFEREVSVIAAAAPTAPSPPSTSPRTSTATTSCTAPRVPANLAELGEAAGEAASPRSPGARLCRRARGRVLRGPMATATARCWSTRSRRACTIPATGRDGACDLAIRAAHPRRRRLAARRDANGATAVDVMENLIGDRHRLRTPALLAEPNLRTAPLWQARRRGRAARWATSPGSPPGPDR
jgi:hypothetical protein